MLWGWRQMIRQQKAFYPLVILAPHGFSDKSSLFVQKMVSSPLCDNTVKAFFHPIADEELGFFCLEAESIE
jgi:hypothetical protein